MKKLLNTLYITDESAYLSLEGETLICKSDEKKLKLPFANIQSIVCFSYNGCSPSLMGKCVENGIGLSFFTQSGRFLARVSGKSQGNVYTRKEQIFAFDKNSLKLAQNTIATKLSNTRYLVERSIRDNENINEKDKLKDFSAYLKNQIIEVYKIMDIDSIRGIEGNCAKLYFSLFNNFILNNYFHINGRSKHPPLDEVNAVLSFLYSMATNDCASALESVGLDSYIGFFHTLRPGRVSLACDLVEEFRAIIDRMVISMINLKVINENDFDKEITGAVNLNKNGRRKVLKAWQEKKKESVIHPFLKEKCQYGILPFIQANLLAKFVRGEIEEYVPFILK